MWNYFINARTKYQLDTLTLEMLSMYVQLELKLQPHLFDRIVLKIHVPSLKLKMVLKLALCDRMDRALCFMSYYNAANI